MKKHAVHKIWARSRKVTSPISRLVAGAEINSPALLESLEKLHHRPHYSHRLTNDNSSFPTLELTDTNIRRQEDKLAQSQLEQCTFGDGFFDKCLWGILPISLRNSCDLGILICARPCSHPNISHQLLRESLTIMPPKRKSGRGGAATSNRAAQSTLSFNSKKGANSKVTKPSAAPQKDVGKKLAAIESEFDVEEQRPTVEVVVREKDAESKAEEEIEGVQFIQSKPKIEAKGSRELEAEKVSDTAVKRYWKKEEESRIAPRGKAPIYSLLGIIS